MKSAIGSALHEQAQEMVETTSIRDVEVGWRTFKEMGGGALIPMQFEGLTVRPSHNVPEGRIWPVEGEQ